MGLSELLKTAEVPKGSFYHYFRSKEAFGVALLEHHYTGYLQRPVDHFDHGEGNYRDRLLAYYQHTLNQFLPTGHYQRLLNREAVGGGVRPVGRYAYRHGQRRQPDYRPIGRSAGKRAVWRVACCLRGSYHPFTGAVLVVVGSQFTGRKLRVAQCRWKAPLLTPNKSLQRLRFNRRFI